MPRLFGSAVSCTLVPLQLFYFPQHVQSHYFELKLFDVFAGLKVLFLGKEEKSHGFSLYRIRNEMQIVHCYQSANIHDNKAEIVSH